MLFINLPVFVFPHPSSQLFRDVFFFAVHFVYKSCHTFRKIKGGIFGRHAKKNKKKKRTVLEKQQKHDLRFQMLAELSIGIFEVLRSLELHRAARSFVCVLSHKHDIRQIA